MKAGVLLYGHAAVAEPRQIVVVHSEGEYSFLHIVITQGQTSD